MEDALFNAIFNKDLVDDYENIMDRVVDHINYRGDDDNGGSGGDGDDGAQNFLTIMTMTTIVMMMINHFGSNILI